MSRPPKYSESELVELTHEAIRYFTNNGQFLRRITVADVWHYGQITKDPEMKRQNISAVVKGILSKHEEEVNEIYGFSIKEFNGALDTLETFNYQEFYRKNKKNIEPALRELGKHINFLIHHDYITTRELKKSNNLLARSEDEQMAHYQKTIDEQKNQIKELEAEIKKLKKNLIEYIDFYKKMSAHVGIDVVKRERLAKVSRPYDPDLNIPEEIARKQEEMDKESILYIEELRKGRGTKGEQKQ